MTASTPIRLRAGLGGVIAGAALAIAVLAVPSTARAQILDGERIPLYDVAITIERDASILVKERIDYDFGTEPHHGIFRDIPVRLAFDDRYDRVYPIGDISVQASPGTPANVKTEKDGNLLRIKIGDPKKTITGPHRYTITYRVRGALNGFTDHDELYWNAIGAYWSVPIDAALVTVTGPADLQRAACFSGDTGSNLPCSSTTSTGAIARFVQSRTSQLAPWALGPFQGMTVVVGFPQGVVPRPTPILKERWAFTRAFALTPASVGAAGALLVLLFAGIGWLLWTRGRDRRYVGSPVDVAYGARDGHQQQVPLFEYGATPVEYAPPDDIRPGQVGTLVDEVAGPLDVTATIVDLAVRGHLRIEEIPKQGWFGKPDWRLVMLKESEDSKGDGLLEFERLLFEGLFEDAESGPDEPEPDGSPPGRPDLPHVKLSKLRTKFGTRLKKVETALYDDAVRRKWFAGRPDKVRHSWHVRGFVLLLAGEALIGLLAAKTHLGLVPIPIALAGLLLLWGSRFMPRRTAKGTGLVRRVFGFRTYIETAEKQEARFQEKENIFSKYLPYAIVFGCTEKWARAFGGLDDELPADIGWYVGPYRFNMNSFASSIDHFSAISAGTIAATPAGSGSSGFSGGGVGGGGGGGGGGSW